MKENRFSIRSRLNSFTHAFNGLKVLFLEEHNARIHVLGSVLVVIAGIYYTISLLEWIALVLSIGLVLVMEIVNTSIERLCDLISLERNESIKTIKDLAAASVLVTAFIAVVVGCIVFLPKL